MNNPAKLSKWVVLCLLMFAAEAHAQLNSFGRDFYCAYLKPGLKCPGATKFQSASLLVSAPYESNVTVSYFAHATGAEVAKVTKHIAAKQSATIPIDLTMAVNADKNGTQINPDGEVPEYTAIHVQSDQPVTVQYYSSGPNAGGMYLVLPTPVLGKEYEVGSLWGDAGGTSPNSPSLQCTPDTGTSEFAVIATQNNTAVTITPSSGTRSGEVGYNGNYPGTHPFQVRLDRGQVFWVKTTVGDQNDMSGSVVVANKPVAVLGGHEDAVNGYTPGAISFEQRNTLVQEMVPVQYWGNSGFYTVPFLDVSGSGFNSFPGDLFRFYGYDKAYDYVRSDNGAMPGTPSFAEFQPAMVENVQYATTFSNQEHSRMMVEQYDYRAQNGLESSSPTMMNVVPYSEYQRTFAFTVPDTARGVHPNHYMNMIAPSSIISKLKVYLNGTPTNLQEVGYVAGQFYSNPGLQPKRYQLKPGSYFIQGDSAFMLYRYGMLGMSPTSDPLYPPDSNDYFYEYASPAGQAFVSAQRPAPNATIDSVCEHWDVHVYDRNFQTSGGLAQVELLNDPLGIEKRQPRSDSVCISSNVTLSKFSMAIGDSSTVFSVAVTNPFKNAEAWLWAVNEAGSDTLFHFTYYAPQVLASPAALTIKNAPLNADTCVSFALRNVGVQDYVIASDAFIYGDSGYRVTASSATLPHTIKPGDSIQFTACLTATQMARVYRDTLLVTVGCAPYLIPFSAISSLAAINSDDYDFGNVNVGEMACTTVRVWNSGTAPMTLTNQSALDDRVNYLFRDSSLVPVTLAPGETRLFNVCFTPRRAGSITAALHWMTDIPAPYSHTVKDMTTLHGVGIATAGVSEQLLASGLRVISIEEGRAVGVMLPEVPDRGTISLLDALGRTVREIPVFGQNVTIDVSTLANGTYFAVYRGRRREVARFTVFH